MMVVAFNRAISLAVSLPIPAEQPVIITTFPFKLTLQVLLGPLQILRQINQGIKRVSAKTNRTTQYVSKFIRKTTIPKFIIVPRQVKSQMNVITLEFHDKKLEKDFVDHVYQQTWKTYRYAQLFTIPTLLWFGIQYTIKQSFLGQITAYGASIYLYLSALLCSKQIWYDYLVLGQLIFYIPMPMLIFYIDYDGTFNDMNVFYVGFSSAYYYQSITMVAQHKYKMILGVIQFFANLVMDLQIHGFSQIKLTSTSYYVMFMISQYFYHKNLRNSYLLLKKDQMWMRAVDQAIENPIIQGVIDKDQCQLRYKESNVQSQKILGISDASGFVEFTRKCLVKRSSEDNQKLQTLEQNLFYYLNNPIDSNYQKVAIYQGRSYIVSMFQYHDQGEGQAVLIIKQNLKADRNYDQQLKLKHLVLKKTIKIVQATLNQSLVMIQKSETQKQNNAKLFSNTFNAGMQLQNLFYFFRSPNPNSMCRFKLSQLVRSITLYFCSWAKSCNINLEMQNHEDYVIHNDFKALYSIFYNLLTHLIIEKKKASQVAAYISINFQRVEDSIFQSDQIQVLISQNIQKICFKPLIKQSIKDILDSKFSLSDTNLSVALYLVGKVGPLRKIHVKESQEGFPINFIFFKDYEILQKQINHQSSFKQISSQKIDLI